MSLLNTNLSLITLNDIMNNPFCNVEIKNSLIILSILETFISQINKDILSEYANKPIELVTLEELSEILLKYRFFENSGLRGVCFERFVYDSLITKQPDITQTFLNFLYKLDDIEISDEVEIVLWGDEKGKWIKDPNLNLTLLQIFKDDLIKISNNEYPFKSILQDISFNNANYGNIGKADLFVKQKNGKYWHGVNVKINIEDLKMSSKKYRNLDIGVALTTKKLNYIDPTSQSLKNLLKKNYIYFFQDDWNFGEILNFYIQSLFILFKEIYFISNNINTNSRIANLPPIFKIMYFQKNKSIFYFISELENHLKQSDIHIPKRYFNENISGSFLFNNKLFYTTENNYFTSYSLKKEISII